jgi:hypothetical protein
MGIRREEFLWGLSQNKSIRMPDTNAPSNECSEAFFNKGAVDKVRKFGQTRNLKTRDTLEGNNQRSEGVQQQLREIAESMGLT